MWGGPPVIFTRRAEWDGRLAPNAICEELQKLLLPAPDDLLETLPVSRNLLRVKEPGPDLLERAAT